ncbi:protein C19orf12 homolog isoform X3 [Scylla paramamosain]|uniref:protein C19orf12 homolog isoform X3 n=2 Tax=Scylla paramamosain TaxID=85552 RepID=UPI0030827FF4
MTHRRCSTMPINTVEILSLVTQVCEEEKLQVPIKESLKGGLIAGTTTTIGGLLGGPIGLAIGGTVGGLTAAYLAQDKFRSVADVIRNDLTPLQKERLSSSVLRIINDFGPADVLALTAFTLQPALKEKMLQEVFHFFQSQLHMQIID